MNESFQINGRGLNETLYKIHNKHAVNKISQLTINNYDVDKIMNGNEKQIMQRPKAFSDLLSEQNSLNLKNFEFDIPFSTLGYPISSFQPTLQTKGFTCNPLYTFSRYRRKLIGQVNSKNLIDNLMKVNETQQKRKRNMFTRSNSSSRQTSRSTKYRTTTGLSAKGQRISKYSSELTSPHHIGMQESLIGSDIYNISRTQVINDNYTHEQPKQNYSVNQIFSDDHREQYILALENNQNLFSNGNSFLQLDNKKQKPFFRGRPKTPNQGPNFPFNLTYMLNHLKRVKSKQDQPNAGFKELPIQPKWRNFSSTVYKAKKSKPSTQFYQSCISMTENNNSKMANSIVLLPNQQSRVVPQVIVSNRPEVRIFENIFAKHKPSKNRNKLILSQLS